MPRYPGILLAASLLAPRPASGAGREIRVAAAADLKFALEEVDAAFRAAQPGTELSITFGSSGNFFAQIQNGAPFDLFLSADIDYARRLAQDGLTIGPPFSYATGRLALCVHSIVGAVVSSIVGRIGIVRSAFRSCVGGVGTITIVVIFA
jgi:molybdate transport system substrate-binding protein